MRNFSIGVFLNVYTGNMRDWERGVNFIKSLKGVEHIEILLEHIPTSNEEVEFLKSLRKEYRLIVHAPFLDLTLLSPHDQIIKVSLERLQQAYKISNKIGADAFTIHAGTMPQFWREEKVLKNIKNAVKTLQTSPGLPVCVENMSLKRGLQIPYPCTSGEIANVSKNSLLTIDIGHLIKSNVDPLFMLKKLHKQIHNIHLHDATVSIDHLPLGAGDLDITGFLATLEEVGYDKFVSIEVVGDSHIKSSWNTLRKLVNK